MSCWDICRIIKCYNLRWFFELFVMHYSDNILIPVAIGLLFHILPGQASRECGLLDSHHNDNSVLPWTVNIYSHNQKGENDFICSGTVISLKIILTAARCFYDDTTQGLKDGPFVITVEKNSKNWISKDGQKFETSTISLNNIVISKQYKGRKGNYAHNLAIIKLTSEQQLSKNVKGACIYWDNELTESDLEANTVPLKAVAWSSTNNEPLSIRLKYVNYDLCLNLLASKSRQFLTFDKMCAETEESKENFSLGSGLYALDTNSNRWHLIGIQSEAIKSESNLFVTFAKIQSHLNWLSNNAFLDV